MKKAISITLSILLLVVLAVPVAAASGTPKIYEITNEAYGSRAYGDYQGTIGTDPECTYPGSTLMIPLLREGFRDEDGGVVQGWGTHKNPDIGEMGPTVRQLQSNKVVAQIGVTKGKDFIKKISIVPHTPTTRNPAQAMILVEFEDFLPATREYDYEFSVYLSLDGHPTATTEVFGGRFGNEVFNIKSYDYLYMGDGIVAHAKDASAMDVTLDLDNGVILHGDMFQGQKFHGYSTLLGNEHQDAIAEAYRPSIDTIIDIHSVDMKINGAYITFEKELSQPQFYVYNLAGEYIGRSNDKLAYSTRYYLAVEEVEIDPALSDHPIAEGDDRLVPEAVLRFMEGGRENAAARLEEK